ncbi:MAG: hypothetical protein K0Q92_3519 [Steroidobacteraceae bacterium]|nr:hypothetical protein [Steroidobacteraceae bacterium]
MAATESSSYENVTAMTRSVSSASSRAARGSFSTGISARPCFVNMVRSSTPAKEGRLSSLRPCLNSDQPCL